MLDQRFLDSLWDGDDPAATEVRLREAAFSTDRPAVDAAELQTQIARALGLQEKFSEAEELLASIDASEAVVTARVALERGRLKNSAGHADAAIPLFVEASRLATGNGLDFLAVDALHMLAIADVQHAADWTAKGLAAVAASKGTSADTARLQRWRVALHNNLGWHHHDAARHEQALVEFRLANDAAVAVGTAEQQFRAQWAIARCLRSLGAFDEALDIQEELAVLNPDAPLVQAELAQLALDRGI